MPRRSEAIWPPPTMIPHLTRSSLHRCLQRHGISRLSEIDGDKPAKRRFKPYPIGYLHTDIAEVQTAIRTIKRWDQTEYLVPVIDGAGLR